MYEPMLCTIMHTDKRNNMLKVNSQFNTEHKFAQSFK